MRVLIQRVSEASVTVDEDQVSEIGTGLLLLVGVTVDDGPDEADFLAGKVANLRIFPDDEGKMNRSAVDLEAEILVVSQFTLYGDVRKGRRPSFVNAAQPDVAEPLIERLADQLRQHGLEVGEGVFGAEMKVALINDGPVTIWMDTQELRS